jgi:type II secretory pathway component PulF
MNFQYTVKSRSGALSGGTLEAASLAEARQQLLAQGLFALSLREIAAAAKAAPRRRAFASAKVKKTDILMATCELHVMVQAGIDLAEAVSNVAANCEHPALAGILRAVHEDVANGLTLSAALRSRSEVFGDSYVASIAAGEASGTIGDSLQRLEHLLRNEIRLRSAIGAALAYPLTLVGVALAVVAALVVFVLPQFGQIFRDLGTAPPPMTSFLLEFSAAVRNHFLLLLLAVGGTTFAIVQIGPRRVLGPWWDRLVLTGPLISRAGQSLMIGRACRLLAAMLHSNVPLLDALKLCRHSQRNHLYETLFRKLEEEVETGAGMTATLETTPFIPSGAAQMIRTAERCGRLAPILETTGVFYEEEGERSLQKLVKLLEPAIIVVMGTIVAVIVASIMLPLLDASSAAG